MAVSLVCFGVNFVVVVLVLVLDENETSLLLLLLLRGRFISGDASLLSSLLAAVVVAKSPVVP